MNAQQVVMTLSGKAIGRFAMACRSTGMEPEDVLRLGVDLIMKNRPVFKALRKAASDGSRNGMRLIEFLEEYE